MSGITNYSVVQNALLVGASNLTAGVCAWNNGSGYVPATVANKGTGRATGIALTSASTQVLAFTLQTCGWLDAATAGLAAGAATWVRVNTTTAALERCTPSGTDDVVGWCDVSGNVALIFGLLTPAIANALGAPSGTGIIKVVTGVVQGAAALLVDADVAANAAIAGTKIADTATQPMAALNVDWSLGTVFTKTLAAGANAITFSNQASGKCISVRVTGASSTLTWPTVKWAAGTPPTQTASGTDVYTFIHDGTSIYGSVIQNMS